MRRWVAAAVLLATCWRPSIVQAGTGPSDGDGNKAPPIVLAGARSVTIQNGTGGITRFTSIPATSVFSTYGGGRKAQCSFVAPHDDFLLSDGSRVAKDTVVTSDYVFVEGVQTSPVPIAPADLAELGGEATRGPLSTATRTFTVFCDSTVNEINFIRLIRVPMVDSLFDPHTQLDRLRNGLQLRRPVVYTNPIVGRFGGLVTRYPSWLAIDPGAWHTQRSNAVVYRGVTMYLYAQPRDLEFIVDFAPNPEKPSPPYRGIIGCIPALEATDDGSAMPALPELPEQTEPGPNGPCMWTPPGPGNVTITARVTYAVTFWANGYTEADADYVWESDPADYLTGELIAVNTNPGG